MNDEDTKAPSAEEIDELLAFLPQLSEPGFVAVKAWHGGVPDAEGVMTWAWPEYTEVAGRLFATVSTPAWMDRQYLAHDTTTRLAEPGFVENATLDQLRTLLTYCVRGERFCDGHWGGMLESGHVERILRRLKDLRPENCEEDTAPRS
jgi:hypothetical protein